MHFNCSLALLCNTKKPTVIQWSTRLLSPICMYGEKYLHNGEAVFRRPEDRPGRRVGNETIVLLPAARRARDQMDRSSGVCVWQVSIRT